MGPPDTILIVDDEVATLEAMRVMLEGEGYGVVTARDGREALQKLFAGLRPCVIVMDLSMPIMDGVAFRHEQLQHQSFADIPFIAYSARTDVRARAEQLRASGYVEKPTEFLHVLSIIRQHCHH